jgi:hypothetical protein
MGGHVSLEKGRAAIHREKLAGIGNSELHLRMALRLRQFSPEQEIARARRLQQLQREANSCVVDAPTLHMQHGCLRER